MMHRVLCLTSIAGLLFANAAAIAADQAVEEGLIRTAIDSYVTAYNQGDAKALAALWTPQAVYINPRSGEQVTGRDAIESQFKEIFAAEGTDTLEVNSQSIQFVSPSVAVEEGSARVKQPDGTSLESDYRAVYVKMGDQWLLDRVTEDDTPVVQSNYEKLKELEWMVGSWIDKDESSRVETTCQWTKNKNFLLRLFSVSVADRIESSGMQIIGWDPSKKTIRSWVFDSEGGFGQGIWTRRGDSWTIQQVGTAPDGSAASSTNMLTMLDENAFTWQSMNRMAGGELLPNVDEVVVERVNAVEED